MAAFAKAIERNFHIEVDLHMLKDGNIAVFHDFSTKRMCRSKKSVPIASLTAADLENDDYRLPNGEKIPLLEELLALCNGKAGLLIELKSTSICKFTFEKQVAAKLKDYTGDFAVQSFNPFSIKWFRKHAPEFQRGQLATAALSKRMKVLFFFMGPFKHLRKTKPHFVSYNILTFPCKRIEKGLAKGEWKLLAWTVNTLDKVKTAKKYKVDNIIFEKIELENDTY
jgi:glycerophosphoryl diester phosphodiesterase